MTPMTRSTALLAIVAAAVLAACGGGSTPSIVAGATSAVVGTAKPTSAPAGGSGADACAMLSDAEILQITGFKPTAKHAGQEFANPGDHCEWDLDNAGPVPWSIALGVYKPGGRDYYAHFFAPDISDGKPIDGIGDGAVDMEAGSIVAVKGDTMIDVQYIEFPDRPQVKIDLAKAILAKV